MSAWSTLFPPPLPNSFEKRKKNSKKKLKNSNTTGVREKPSRLRQTTPHLSHNPNRPGQPLRPFELIIFVWIDTAHYHYCPALSACEPPQGQDPSPSSPHLEW